MRCLLLNFQWKELVKEKILRRACRTIRMKKKEKEKTELIYILYIFTLYKNIIVEKK